MATLTFQIDDGSAGGTNPAVWVSITENADGTLTFDVTQQGGVVGDLRGIFFDVADESLLSSLVVKAVSNDIRIGDDSIKDLGDGANMNGLLGSDRGYDVGIEIGSAGIGKDDVRSYSFTLDSTARDLTLADFAHVDFGARLTSVGLLGGSRADSSKLVENTSAAIALNDVESAVNENESVQGNVLHDASYVGTTTITGWSGGAAGAQVALVSEGDDIGALKLNADGSYVLDAGAADELSAGESISFTFDYSAKNQDEATSWSTDSAKLTVVVNGTNDGPVASDDAATAAENGTASGSVLANDSDVDRLDTIAVAGIAGGSLGQAIAIENGAGATVTLNADGSFTLDASAADALSAGEVVTHTFQYTLADNHGATDTASFTATVTGANDGPEALDDTAGSIAENAAATGNVLGNDTDIDRLDVLGVSAVNGVTDGGEGDLDAAQGVIAVKLASGATVSVLADGTYAYDTNGAFDALNDGETANDAFEYTAADGHGGSDSATVGVTVVGSGQPPAPPEDPREPQGPQEPLDLFPTMAQMISNVVLYLDDGDAATKLLKLKLEPASGTVNDIDHLHISDVLTSHSEQIGANTMLLGISVHAGQEYPNAAAYDMTAQGEGAFYFLGDGETPLIAPIGQRDDLGWTADWSNDDVPLTAQALAAGFTNDLLQEQAALVFAV